MQYNRYHEGERGEGERLHASDKRYEHTQLYLRSYFCNQLTSQNLAGGGLGDAVDKCYPPQSFEWCNLRDKKRVSVGEAFSKRMPLLSAKHLS